MAVWGLRGEGDGSWKLDVGRPLRNLSEISVKSPGLRLRSSWDSRPEGTMGESGQFDSQVVAVGGEGAG